MLCFLVILPSLISHPFFLALVVRTRIGTPSQARKDVDALPPSKQGDDTRHKTVKLAAVVGVAVAAVAAVAAAAAAAAATLDGFLIDALGNPVLSYRPLKNTTAGPNVWGSTLCLFAAAMQGGRRELKWLQCYEPSNNMTLL